MFRMMCRAKIHRAILSEADLNYVGSMTIPRDILSKLDILEGEQVDVLNVNTGARITTYAITGEKSGYFCLNGAAARHGQPGDVLIIMVYALMEDAAARKHKMKIALMNPDNTVEKFVN